MRLSRKVTLFWADKPDTFSPAPGLAKGRPRMTPPGDTDVLLTGDNLPILRDLARSHSASVTLAYLDPPFFTNRVHDAVSRRAGEKARSRRPAFDDRWADRALYLEALGVRLHLLRDLLAPHGSVVIHVDPRTSHYIKVLADEIFGEEAFASEIIWRYRRWPSKTPNFQRVHDVLLRYRKDPRVKPRWNPLYEPLSASTVATWGHGKQRAIFAKDGRRERSSTTSEPTRGAPMGDVWDIGVIAPVSRERTGYPSQKPEALLSRLIEALSSPGDLVLDPYAGSGTTLVVAARLARRFIGIDCSDVAIETARSRLASIESCAPGTAPRTLCSGQSGSRVLL